MASGDEKKAEVKKGFSGLSSLASDVEVVINQARTEGISQSTQSPVTGNTGPGSRSPPHLQQKKQSENYPPAPQPKGGASNAKWFVGLAFLAWLIWLTFPHPLESPPSANTQRASDNASVRTQGEPVVLPTKPANIDTHVDRFVEEKPPVGRNNILGIAQIRYCVAEDIRLDATRNVIDNYSEDMVKRFNVMVDDYNKRCGEFRYRHGALETARSDVERYRKILQSEGRDRFALRPKSKDLSVPSTAHSLSGKLVPNQMSSNPAGIRGTNPNPTVLSIQKRLNELGYMVGSADGLIGPRTQAAIRTFQEDHGIPADGVASSTLLSTMNSAQILDAPLPRASAAPSSTPSAKLNGTEEQRPVKQSTDRGNLERCISGKYPALCNHGILSNEEAVQVGAAERRENFNGCISGKYPALCNHGILSNEEAVQVGAAERRENLKGCISGKYPALCNHGILSNEEAVQVGAAERRENFKGCISGKYPALCNHGSLSNEEALQVGAAERRENFNTCISGKYPALCNHTLLTRTEAQQVATEERRAGN